MTRLIVNADDLGYTEGVSRGIVGVDDQPRHQRTYCVVASNSGV